MENQTFTKALDINNRSYEFKLNLDPKASILTFNVKDKTDPQNSLNFFNKFSLNQDDNTQNQQINIQNFKKILNY